MAMFSLRLDDDLAARFDAAAIEHGGRSARLRQLIAGATGVTTAAQVGPRDAARLMVRLGPAEARAVAGEAAAMCLTRSGWVAALVRRWVGDRPTFARRDELALIAVHGEIRRIGVNVNQIARALNVAVIEGRVLDLEIASIEDVRRELQAHMAGLRAGFEGNLAYWEVRS